MNNLDKMTDDELHVSAVRAARFDRQAQVDTISHLMEVDSRRLHAKMGYSGIFSYAVSALGFSEPAAGQRVQAVRLAQSVPLANTNIRSGQMSVSSAASVQQFIRKEEKVNGRVLSDIEKERIISEVSGKSARETVRVLLSFATQLEPHVLKEKITPLTPTRTQLMFYITPETIGDVERVRELKGDLSLESIFKSALSLYLDRMDPARKPIRAVPEQSTKTSGVEPSRYIPVSLLQSLQQRSGGQCEFVSEETGRRCEGRFRLEVEHRIPFSLGGATDLINCFYYCRNHNLHAAVEIFGDKMKPYLSS